MAYAPNAGVTPAIIFAVAMGIAAAIWIATQTASQGTRLRMFHVVGVLAAAFAAGFAVLNLIVQVPAIDMAHVKAEIASGELALRATSVAFLISFALILRRTGKLEPAPTSFLADSDTLQDNYEREIKRAEYWPLEWVASEASALMITLAALWSFTITGHRSPVIALLNWLFAFIADDFVLAASYRWHSGVLPPTFDALRIGGGVILIVVLFLVAAFQEFNHWIAAGLVGIIILFFVIIPFLRRFARGFWAAWSTLGEVSDPDEYHVQLTPELRARAEILAARSKLKSAVEKALILERISVEDAMRLTRMDRHIVIPSNRMNEKGDGGKPNGQDA